MIKSCDFFCVTETWGKCEWTSAKARQSFFHFNTKGFKDFQGLDILKKFHVYVVYTAVLLLRVNFEHPDCLGYILNS